MADKIGNVDFDLQYYKGTDSYSDGIIEDELLEIVKSKKDANSILEKDNRWSILYHLSQKRRNLLEWLPFVPDSHVLEIGAGCGALTGLLCEKVNKVTAVELSKKRAEIIAYRYSENKNLRVIVGNLNDIPLPEKSFEYITLIGVLEYAGMFTNGQNPELSFLNLIRGLLKENGTLVIAIENKFGLKYWSGSREDHTNQFFDSLENYPNYKGVRTFSRDGLEKLIETAGFENISFYYPMPDYKLPDQVFSDLYPPKKGDLRRFTPNYDADRLRLFNEKLVFDNLIENKKFGFFANSFLVTCQKSEEV